MCDIAVSFGRTRGAQICLASQVNRVIEGRWLAGAVGVELLGNPIEA